MKPPAYTPVAGDDESLNLEKQLLRNYDSGSFSSVLERRAMLFILILSIATSIFASLSVVLAVKLSTLSQETITRNTRFDTEIASAETAIRIEETVFTGGLLYDGKDQIYREIEPHSIQYVGPPTPQLDAAWDKLLAPLGMVLNDEEAGNIKGTTYQEPDGSWLMTLDVYHSLHCVNLVRQALDPDYYPVIPKNARVHRLHTDHCLDYLRQALQCSADLTPLTYLWSESRHSRYPVFGAKHTCRDFEKVQEWTTQRLGNYTL